MHQWFDLGAIQESLEQIRARWGTSSLVLASDDGPMTREDAPAGAGLRRACSGRPWSCGLLIPGRRTRRAQPAAPMKPASPPSAAYSMRVFAAGMGKAMLADVGADVVQERRAGGDHAAAEEDDVRVDRVHQADGADGQIAGRLAHQAAGQRVAGLGGLGDGAGRSGRPRPGARARTVASPRPRASTAPLDQRGRRGVRLQVAEAAAGALPAVLHLDDDVPALGAVAVPPLDDPALGR